MININFIPDLEGILCTDGLTIDSKGVTKQYMPSLLGIYKNYKRLNGMPSFKHVDKEWYVYWTGDFYGFYWKVSIAKNSDLG